MSRWAILNDEKLAINIIEGERLEGLRLPLGQAIVNIDNFNVTIGDSYEGSVWHNDVGEVAPKLSVEQELLSLIEDSTNKQNDIDELTMMVLELGGALVG